MRKYQALFLAFIFITSCNSNSHIPSDIIKPGQMQNIFWDIIRGDILAQELGKQDSTKNIKSESFAIAEKVFTIHHINQDKFKKSIAFYAKHPILMKTIFDSLNAMQTRKDSFGIEKRRPGKSYPHFPTHIIKAQ
ncbi:MAG: DUF4296 domain-containing protein [Ginsengibacter sp.]